ncbi:MAG: hypothetical protein Q7S87_01120 [Agitococcus sp.]|nr:hypothetical protein [Agitococcus sp.]
MSATPAACFATLVHDLGKGVTPSHEWPKHHQHETAGLPLVTSVCSRLGVPDYWTQLALFVCEKHIVIHRSFELRPRTVVTLVDQMTRGHGSTFMEDALVACESDARGRLGFENKAYPQGAFLREVGQALQAEAATACLLRTNREEQAAHLRRLAMVRQIQKKFVAGT